MDFASEQLKLTPFGEGWLDPQDGDNMESLQEAYLGRLRRLLNLRTSHHEDLNDQGLWLLDRSIFTTYCDCVELGAGFVAQNMIRRLSSQGTGNPCTAMGSARERPK